MKKDRYTCSTKMNEEDVESGGAGVNEWKDRVEREQCFKLPEEQESKKKEEEKRGKK